MSQRMMPWAWIGAVAGVLLGAADFALIYMLGVRVEGVAGGPAYWVVAVFGLTFGAFGFLLGRLMETRRRLRHGAETIRRQMLELRETQKRALQNEKLASIGRLAASVAHEVRNALGVVRSAAGLLSEGLEADPDARKAGRFMREEIDRLDGFIRTLLDFAKPLEAERKWVNVAGLIDEVRLRADVDVGQLRLNAPGNLACIGDVDLLIQALLPLVVNARESCGAGGRIAIEARARDGNVEIDVVDDGPSIHGSDVARIFEPFFTTKAQGTGLGLPMAERIARAHGGALRYVDRHGLAADGGGACFRLTLPGATAVEAA